MKLIKKHQKLIVFILTCLSIYLIYNCNDTNHKITYISLGDGYAEGLNSYYQPSYGYSDYLKDYLEQQGNLNYYYSGFSDKEMTLKDLRKDILINVKEKEGHTSIKEALRESNLLTLSIGLNDIRYKLSEYQNPTSKQQQQIVTEIKEEMQKTIKEIKKYYKYDIYIVSYNNLYPQNSVERKLLEELNKEYKKLEKEDHMIYIKNTEIEENPEKYLENPTSIYPNELGYKEIYQNIQAKIEK